MTLTVTVAVTVSPAATGFGESVNVVDVSALLTCWVKVVQLEVK
jgi:hypothetical protein